MQGSKNLPNLFKIKYFFAQIKKVLTISTIFFITNYQTFHIIHFFHKKLSNVSLSSIDIFLNY